MVTTFDKKDTMLPFTEQFFSTEEELDTKSQASGFSTIMAKVLKENNGEKENLEIMKSVQEHITSKIENTEGTCLLEKEQLSNILKESGATKETVDAFKTEYEETFNDKPLLAESIIDKKVVEFTAPSIVIKAKPEVAKNVTSRTIDGKQCLVIDIDKINMVQVNGVYIS